MVVTNTHTIYAFDFNTALWKLHYALCQQPSLGLVWLSHLFGGMVAVKGLITKLFAAASNDKLYKTLMEQEFLKVPKQPIDFVYRYQSSKDRVSDKKRTWTSNPTHMNDIIANGNILSQMCKFLENLQHYKERFPERANDIMLRQLETSYRTFTDHYGAVVRADLSGYNHGATIKNYIDKHLVLMGEKG